MGAILIILTFYFADISLLPMLFKIIQIFFWALAVCYSLLAVALRLIFLRIKTGAYFITQLLIKRRCGFLLNCYFSLIYLLCSYICLSFKFNSEVSNACSPREK